MEPRYDVVVFDIATREVSAIVGRNLHRDKGHSNAERRLETAHARINDAYDAAIVPMDSLEVGMVVPPETEE